MVDTVADHSVDFINDHLVCVQVKLIVIQSDDELRITAIHSLTDRSLNLQVQVLNITIQHHILLELRQELCLAVAVILGTPFVDLTQTDLVNRFLNYQHTQNEELAQLNNLKFVQ